MAKRKIKIRHLLCLLFLIYVLSTFIYQQFRIMDLTKQEAELNAKKRRPLSKEKSSKKEISLLHTDEYIEVIARDELGLVKPGEYIIKSTSNNKQ